MSQGPVPLFYAYAYPPQPGAPHQAMHHPNTPIYMPQIPMGYSMYPPYPAAPYYYPPFVPPEMYADGKDEQHAMWSPNPEYSDQVEAQLTASEEFVPQPQIISSPEQVSDDINLNEGPILMHHQHMTVHNLNPTVSAFNTANQPQGEQIAPQHYTQTTQPVNVTGKCTARICTTK